MDRKDQIHSTPPLTCQEQYVRPEYVRPVVYPFGPLAELPSGSYDTARWKGVHMRGRKTFKARLFYTLSLEGLVNRPGFSRELIA